MALKENYVDALFTGTRKYHMIQNDDGTVSFIDATTYEQVGDQFGAKDINETNMAVNEKMDNEKVVDPTLATEEGYAADAYMTGKALESLNSNIANKFAVLTFTFPSTAGEALTLSYPDGFSKDNTVVLSLSVYLYNRWYSSQGATFVGQSVTLYDYINIAVDTNSSDTRACGSYGKVVLFKTHDL